MTESNTPEFEFDAMVADRAASKADPFWLPDGFLVVKPDRDRYARIARANSSRDARRIARVPELEAEVIRLRDELAAAWLAGRDAAAQIADDHTPEKHSGMTLASHVTGRAIAAAIRAMEAPR